MIASSCSENNIFSRYDLHCIFLEVFSILATGVLRFPFSGTHHNKRILGTAHSSRGDVAGTCQACSRGGLPRCCSPCPRPATPRWGSNPARRSAGMGRTEISILQKHSGARGQEEERRGALPQPCSGTLWAQSLTDSLPQHLPTCHVPCKVPLSPP